jgi:MFS family permease
MVFLLGFSSGIILIATPLFLVELAVSQVDFGLVIGATSIGALIIKIPMGVLSDKIGKKRMLYAGCFMLMISITLFPVFPRWLLLFRVAQGFSMSMIMVPLAALFVEMFRESGKVAWFNSSLSLGAAVIGPLFGGILPQIVGFTYTFLFSAVLLLFSVRVLPHIDEPRMHYSTAVIKKERNVPSLVNASTLGAANTAAFVIFSSFMPLFAAKVLNLSSGLIGFVVFLEGITFVLLAIPVGKMADGFGRLKVLLLGSVITLFEFFIFYISTTFTDLVLASILVGVSAAFVVPTSFSLAADSLPEKGKAMGIYQTSNNVGALIGPGFAGILSAAFGIKYAFLSIIPIILVCWGVFVIIYYRSKISFYLNAIIALITQ